LLAGLQLLAPYWFYDVLRCFHHVNKCDRTLIRTQLKTQFNYLATVKNSTKYVLNCSCTLNKCRETLLKVAVSGHFILRERWRVLASCRG